MSKNTTPTLLQVRNAIMVLERAGLLEEFDPWGGATRFTATEIAAGLRLGVSAGSGKSGTPEPKKRKKRKAKRRPWSRVTEKDIKRYQKLREQGVPKMQAAKLVGHHQTTMQSHLDALLPTVDTTTRKGLQK